MRSRLQDTVFGIVLLVVAVVWIGLVLMTIPAFDGIGVGPRAFPLVFGLLLAALTAALLFRLYQGSGRSGVQPRADLEEDVENAAGAAIHWLPALLLLGEIVLYGYALEKIGFVLATPLIILLVMVVNLRNRSIKRCLGMALGLTLGCWLIFEQGLGIYLATGTWINLG